MTRLAGSARYLVIRPYLRAFEMVIVLMGIWASLATILT